MSGCEHSRPQRQAKQDVAPKPEVVEGRVIYGTPYRKGDIIVVLFEGKAPGPSELDHNGILRDSTYNVGRDGKFVLRVGARSAPANFFVYADVEHLYLDTCVYKQLPRLRFDHRKGRWVEARTKKPLRPITLSPNRTTACY